MDGRFFRDEECRFQRPKVAGKFLYVGQEKFWVRGVTYGAFRPDARGNEYHDLKIIRRDFAQMAANGRRRAHSTHHAATFAAGRRTGAWPSRNGGAIRQNSMLVSL